MAKSHTVGPLEFYVGVTHLRFPTDDVFDTELGAGVLFSDAFAGIDLAVDSYYSLDVDGSFTEISAARGFELCSQTSAEIAAVLGINSGYISDGHNGANHFALALGLEHALSDSVSLGAHATYSWAINRESALAGDDTLIDFFHAGVSLTHTF